MTDETEDELDDAFIGYWCYRIWSQETPDGLWYTVRETYFRDNGTVDGYSSDATGVSGESVDELRQTLEWMKSALGKPVLRVEDYPSPQDDQEDVYDEDFQHFCRTCGYPVTIVRPGKYQCDRCEDAMSAQMNEMDIISTDVFPYEGEE